MDKATATAVLVSACCMLVIFAREAWRAWVSKEFKEDLERLRAQRRARRLARRG